MRKPGEQPASNVPRSSSLSSTAPSRPLSVTLIAPQKAQCGVSDYTQYLLPELRRVAEVKYVVKPDEFVPTMNAVDLVHIQHQYFLFGGVAPWKSKAFRQLADQIKVPVVMTVHEFVEPAGSLLHRMAIQKSNQAHFAHPNIRRLIVHTEHDRERMAQAGIAADTLTVIPHGVPPAPALPDRETARRALDVEDRFVLTLFGFLSQRKGHRFAIRAMRYLPEEVVLYLAGGQHPDDTTPYVSELEAAVAKYGLQDRVIMTGYLAPVDVAQVMAATDLVLAPFLESSGSGSLALAFACGKPILASNIPPHQELLASDPDALRLMRVSSSSDLAREIETLHKDAALRERTAAGASRYAHTHSYARMAEETAAVYAEAVSA